MTKNSSTPTRKDGTSGRDISYRKLAALLGPALIIIVVLFGGGLLLGLVQALGYAPAMGSAAISLHHFAKVLLDPGFGKSLVLTLHIATTSTVIAAAVSVMLALALNRFAAESRTIYFILQIPLTLPHLVIAVSFMLLLAPAGLLSRLFSTLGVIHSPGDFPLLVNDSWGISILAVYIWKEIPFITFMLLAVLKNMGEELLEAGATLNASRFQRLIHITLPILGPSLGAASLIVFAFTFGAFEVPFLLGRTYPMTLPVWAYKDYSDIDLLARPEGIALGLIIAVIVIAAIVLAQLLLRFGRIRGLSG